MIVGRIILGTIFAIGVIGCLIYNSISKRTPKKYTYRCPSCLEVVEFKHRKYSIFVCQNCGHVVQWDSIIYVDNCTGEITNMATSS
jgi:ribosomal protein L37AE/L43A